MTRLSIKTGNAVLVVAMLSVLAGCTSSKTNSNTSGAGFPSASGSTNAAAVNDVVGSSFKKVFVRQAPITVRKEYFDLGSRQSQEFSALHNQSANTRWQFRCVPRFRFDITDKKQLDKVVTVKLRITDVNIDLSAPVIIFLPKQAKPEVVSHEEGHFKICQKVYDMKAKPAAQAAAEALIGKEFEGTGPTLAEASQQALHRAAQEMGREFRSKTIDYLDRVSTYYDQLAPQHPEAKYVDACVEGAFKADQQLQMKTLKSK